VQVVLRLVDQELNPQSAVDAPRWQVLDDGTLALERGFSAETIAGLRSRGHKVQLPGEARDAQGRPAADPFFGGAQMAYRNGATFIAASDPRRDGQAVGY
jgi:gamma-glutamyltranspeptidase/glutathione hydrolase